MNVYPSPPPDLFVLCGGQGARLRSILNDRPKPLAMIGSRPFVDFVIDSFVRQGIRRVVLCTGYLGDQFEKWYTDHPREIELGFSRERAPLGTAGAIRHATQWITGDSFLVANGDSLCEVNLRSLLTVHAEKQARATLALTQANYRSDVGVVTMDAQQRIAAFCEKGPARPAGFHNAGIYVFHRSAIELIPASRPWSLETDWLPALLPSGVYGFVSEAPLYDIGTPERLAEFRATMHSDGPVRGGRAASRPAACA